MTAYVRRIAFVIDVAWLKKAQLVGVILKV